MSQADEVKKQKTCVCISCFNYYETRIQYIRRFFERKGIIVTYVTSNYNHFEKSFFKADYPNTIQVAVPKYKKNISIARIVSQLTFAWKTYNYIKQISPDIIYCMFPPNSLISFISRYKRKHCCKVVFDGYDMWPECLPVGGIVRSLLSPFLKIWANLRDKTIEQADLVLVCSQNFVEIAKRLWPNVPVKLLLPGIVPSQLPAYTYNVDNQVAFCYLGNINHITDIDLLVEVLGKISEKRKVILHIIGEGLNLDELLEKAQNVGIICRPHGVVMDEKVKREIYEQCNLGINLPREEIHSTMSLKSVEYMGVGLPYINTGGGDNWDIVDTCNVGINIDRNDTQKSAEAVLELTNEKLSVMSKNCLDYSKRRFESQDLETILKEVFDKC